MQKAYAYIRWSTAAQLTGDSETRQLAELERFEQNTGIEIVRKFRDSGRSAFRGDNSRRGEFRLLLDCILSGEIVRGDYIVVESIDRITRQRVLDGVQIIQDILKSGVNLYTTTDQKTYSIENPSEDLQTLLMISVIAQRAYEESETKSKRLKSSWSNRRKAAESGKVIIKKGKSIPYGLRYINGEFVIDKGEQQEIKNLFELLLTHGLNSAIKIINQNSLKKWNNGTVNKILANRTVIGFMPIHRSVHGEDGKTRKTLTGEIENYYPNIIEPSLFYRAVSAMNERKIEGYSGRRGEQDYNIFKNIIFCSICGGKLYYDHRGSRYGDKIYPYFKCDNRRTNHKPCESDNLRFEHVLGLALSAFRNAEKTATELREIKSISENAVILTESLSSLSSRSYSQDNEYLLKMSELGDAESKLDSLTRNVKQMDFNVPKLVMKQLSELEKKVEALMREVERLAAGKVKFDIDMGSQNSIMSHFMTEVGRGKLNSFFKANNITFHASYKKGSRFGSMELRREEVDTYRKIAESRITFPAKDILKSFGLGSLQEMFDLKPLG